MRGRNSIVVVVALAGLVVGCPVSIQIPASSVDFQPGSGTVDQSVPRSARTKCRDAGFSDDYIDTMFTIIRTDRNLGFSREVELAVAVQGCSSQDCSICATAVINEV